MRYTSGMPMYRDAREVRGRSPKSLGVGDKKKPSAMFCGGCEEMLRGHCWNLAAGLLLSRHCLDCHLLNGIKGK